MYESESRSFYRIFVPCATTIYMLTYFLVEKKNEIKYAFKTAI